MRQDLRFALRVFHRQRGVFALAILGLAAAIGLSTAMFTVVNAAYLRGSGLPHPEQVFQVELRGLGQTTGDFMRTQGDWSLAAAMELTNRVPHASITASERFADRVRIGDRAFANAWGRAVDASYFSTLRIGARIGRTLDTTDATASAQPAIVLSHAFWKNFLGADRTILGQTAWVGDQAYTIVGVAQPGLNLATGGMFPPTFWTPLAHVGAAWTAKQAAIRRGREDQLAALTMRPNLPAAETNEAHSIVAALAEPVAAWNPAVEVLCRIDDPAQAAAVEAAFLPIAQAYAPEHTGGSPILTSVRLSSFASMSAQPVVLGIVFALQALIVVIAIANVTNVLFASTASRAREIGTRLALGASRARIARQLLTEGALLSVGAGVLGLLVAQWLTPLVANILASTPTWDWNPDRRVFIVVAVSAVVAGLTASVAPIRYVRRGDLLGALRTERAGAPRGERVGRFRSTTIAVQTAASIVLLVLAALFSRSALRLLNTDLGFDPDRLISTYVSFNGAPDPVRLANYLTAARDRLRQLPGVSAVGLSTGAPFEISVPALPGGRYVHRAMTSPDFFTLRGAHILRGRAYTTDDLVAGAHVAVISQSLARQYWGDADPVGSSLERVWGPDDRPGTYGLTAKPAGTRVVGVAADMVGTIENIDAMAIYMPLRRKDLSVARILIETSTPAAGLEEPIRKTLRSLSTDPGIAIKTTIVSTYVDQSLRFPKTLAAVTSVVGLTALGLAAIGLFGVMAFVVGQREHEMAVRTALGARAGDIVRMLLREGLRPVFFGLAAGLLLAFIVSRLLQRAFYGVTEHDPIAITVAIVVLLAAAAAAILIPARRAAKIDPARMLREQ